MGLELVPILPTMIPEFPQRDFDAGQCKEALLGFDEPVMPDLDAAPYGGARFPIEARMDGRIFVEFHINIAAGEVVMRPVDTTKGRDWLKFAGIPAPSFPTISREQHFAEKVHAYTLPRPSTNSRARDLVDMVLLITSVKKLNPLLVRKAIDATFKRRKTHELPAALKPPPADWKEPYAGLARQCGISEDLDHAFELADSFLRSIGASGRSGINTADEPADKPPSDASR